VSSVYALYLESGPRMKTTMVHVLDLLGCVANGPTTEAALEATPGEVRRYLRFLRDHGEPVDPDAPLEAPIATHVMEGPWIGYGDPAPGFPPDLQPLSRDELATHLRRLRWMGEELAEIARNTPAEVQAAVPEKGRPIAQIIRHVCEAEPSYLQAGRVGKPEGLRDTLRAIEAGEEMAPLIEGLWDSVIACFEAASDDQLWAVFQRGQSPYSARRGLRRALEHPWEHLREIQRRLEAEA
jgi:predicted RNase H-like HicB family nuclease